MKRSSALKAQYSKQRHRIQNQMWRMSKRGYEFTKSILPPIPKKITEASIRRLKKITTKSLYENAEHIDYDTGEVITGRQYRQRERTVSTRKARRTRMINRARRKTAPDVPTSSPEPDSSINDYIQAWEWLISQINETKRKYPDSAESLEYIVNHAVDSISVDLTTYDYQDRLAIIERILGRRILNAGNVALEAVQTIDESAYNIQGRRFVGACNTLSHILLDRPMAMDENQSLTNALEQDLGYTDYDE